jgi:hypothetical protein
MEFERGAGTITREKRGMQSDITENRGGVAAGGGKA